MAPAAVGLDTTVGMSDNDPRSRGRMVAAIKRGLEKETRPPSRTYPVLTSDMWNEKTCPECSEPVDEEPPERCTTPRFRLLHWLAYLSEDRVCASWQLGNQAVVLDWCIRPAPEGADLGFLAVDEREAKEVLALVEAAAGKWLWCEDEFLPKWYARGEVR